jgi:DNA repair ATPase RecN
MSDSEFQKLEKAEQEVLAQIARQKKIRDDLRNEFQALRDAFVGSYDAILRPLESSLARLSGNTWEDHRGRLGDAITDCSASIPDSKTSEEIGALQSALKVRIKGALAESDSTVNQFQEMSASLRMLEAIVAGKGTKDFLQELQVKKQRLEKEEERLQSLQDRYDRYFGDRKPIKSA